MGLVLQGGWLPSADDTASADCTCSLLDAQWLREVTDLEQSLVHSADAPVHGNLFLL